MGRDGLRREEDSEMAMVGDCKVCKHIEECYPILVETNMWADDLFVALVALRKRDLCVNSGKIDWEAKN